MTSISGYSMFRRDRRARKGGGVAIYVQSSMSSSEWLPPFDDRTYELLWVHVGDAFVGAVYHPPKPQYSTDSLLQYVEACVDELYRHFPTALVVLAGDFNQISEFDVVEHTGLTPIVHQPTRGSNLLDRIFVSFPRYDIVRVVKSTVRSDHKAIVAHSKFVRCTTLKTTVQKTFRKKTPSQNALLLQHLATLAPDNPEPTTDCQTEFDQFYATALGLLNQYYPERTITITSRDPEYITADIKAKLRRKNRLMRAGRIEEADCLAERIGKDIIKSNKARLSHINPKTGAKEMWTAVRQLTGRKADTPSVPGVTADSLNNHYAAISTDKHYQVPPRKSIDPSSSSSYISEWRLFQILDTLRPTATGLDHLPAWFLRLAAPFLYKPLTRLFNLSVATSTVPQQWKSASIRPLPKVNAPKAHSDFRPISITPVLSRIMERTVVRHFLYPALLNPPPTLSFFDQYAFRPTGSTTAAIISILHAITSMLSTNPYVVVIALDFSKAFDTVRHYTLLYKLAQMDIPNNVYNWITDFLSQHSHNTVYQNQVSTLMEISASIIQGSSVGPALYVVNTGDLKTVSADNTLCKYADDTYLIIPASNIATRNVEIENIEKWSHNNNLTLNRSKSTEIVFTDPKRKSRQIHPPPPLPDIDRSTSVKILGVTFTNHLSVAQHVHNVTSSCSQHLYALKVLRAHGMCDEALQHVFRTVIISKICYASSAWWGFTSAADRQHLEAFLRRSTRSRLCPPEQTCLTELVEAADDSLFQRILSNDNHILSSLLPPKTNNHYSLRKKHHDRELLQKTTHLFDCNFIVRLLYKDCY